MIRVPIAHSLGKDEARRRLKARAHEIADFIPGGAAEVKVDWPDADTMDVAIRAMGQDMAARITVEETQMLFEVTLPAMLSFVEPMVKSAVEAKGRKLLT